MVVLLFGIPLQRYSFILLYKIKRNYFCLFCKILLQRACLSGIAVYFCVARENLRPRHGVIFSMPSAWRGVKIFLNLSMIFQGAAKGYCSTLFLQMQNANANF